MSLLVAAGLFGGGLLLVVASAERLVESTIGLSHDLGLSAFLISVIFIGFDPENLAVGAVASADQAVGLALGTIAGSAMVALALAFGLTAVVVPLEFRRVPRRMLLLPLGAVLLILGLAIDGTLSRIDGALLLAGYAGAVVGLIRWERRGIHVAPTESVADEAAEMTGLWRSAGWFTVSLGGLLLGSELLLRGARPIIDALGWTDTLFGMTLLALLISVEEVARELPAALKGRPDVSYGNVVGSALAFFGFNAGVIALIRPLPVANVTRYFYLPVCAGTVALIAAFLRGNRLPRWGGFVLLMMYLLFVAGPFLT